MGTPPDAWRESDKDVVLQICEDLKALALTLREVKFTETEYFRKWKDL